MLEGLSFAERRSLSGNGMLMCQVLVWQLYIMSHCVRRCYLERLGPPLKSARITHTTSSQPDTEADSDVDVLTVRG